MLSKLLYYTTKLFWATTLLLGIISCSEDETIFNLDDTYESSKIEHSDIRLFTTSGEVIENSVKLSFIERYKEYVGGTAFLEEDVLDVEDTQSSKISFQDDKIKMETVLTSSNYTYTMEDDLIRVSTGDTLSYIKERNNEVQTNIEYYKPFYEEMIRVPGSMGFNTMVRFSEERYINIYGGVLKAPLLTYLLVQQYEGSFSRSIYRVTNLNNKLNEGIYEHLGAKDTLLVQQNWLVYDVL
ncbi:hypothetical protein [Flammeovirga sp. EKP202]|uniref:hypothetical protein n=1 Tax=Flammeovirga sp. EKP202 TaxID=2770592 RepID=UPI00165F07D5|nr:hypothetical protein [Flammeovirga sp. EKP202]MBD0405274.1 hypothetical protein [Flammeovirga sp. EKP202]